ncbi:MAG TPA: OmpA family protein [Gammaproteobacteria bacterium]|nr:OmpA family protein [Gammaproteobacteria bacterium]
MKNPSRTRVRIISLLAVAALALPGLTLAQSDGGGETPGHYIGIGGGINWLHDSNIHGVGGPFTFYNSVQYDTGWAGILTFGHLSPSGWRSELEFNYRRNDIDSSNRYGVGRLDATGDAVSYGLFFNGLYDFQTGSVITPYIGIGLGYMRVDYRDAGPFGVTASHPQGRRVDGFDAGIGGQVIAGLKFNLSDHMALAVDYRYYGPIHLFGFDPTFDNTDATWSGNTLMVTFQFGFGGHEAPPPAPVQAPAPPPQPMDSDDDGVTDNVDRCPNTSPGTEVDNTGCSTDLDNDGVANARDQCPHTRAGAEVNYQGCLVLRERKLNSLHFAFDSAKLTPEDRRYLNTEEDKINNALSKYPHAQVEIAGYTDSIGTDNYNKELSQRRTDSVRNYLVTHAVDPGRIISHGYGETDPVATNNTKSGRARNRRVEVRLIGHRKQPQSIVK